jgi:fatty-acyl-CoA synthase
MIVGDWLARRAQLTPDKVALIDATGGAGAGRRPITYREWNAAANRTANLLRERLGVQRGDRVAVLALNCVEYLDLWFACGKLGAILQTLNWRLAARELAALIDDGTPVVLVYGAEFAETVAALMGPGGARHQPQLVALGTGGSAPAAGPEALPFLAREGHSDEAPPEVEMGFDDPWVICYTGGTTGLPKGALLTHGNVTWNAINTVTSWGLTPDDVAVLNAPLFHTGGLNVFTAPLVHIGGSSIVCRGFDPDQVFDLVRDGGVTIYFGVPTTFIALQQHPRWAEADFARLKFVISGGAPCPLPVFETFWARGVSFKTGYGLTEAGPNNFWLPAEEVRRKPGAVGFPLFHVDARLVRAGGEPCAADEVGELLLRGPHVCAGYWNQPEESARAIVDGWLHTGDLARRDAEGCYTIVGRLKDMIISGGENIYPAEVESVLAAHPAVAEAALIGVPDPRWGEVGRAIVVPRPGAAPAGDVLVEELIAFCRDRLGHYKVPRSVVFVEELPKTGAGKIDKARLVERYGRDTASRLEVSN